MSTHAHGARRQAVGLLFIASLAVVGAAFLQSSPIAAQPAKPESTPRNDARPADVASIDAILLALYDTISGPAGPRDWDRLRSLFLPGARLIPCRRPPGGSLSEAKVYSVDEFIKLVEAGTKDQGFFEREICRKSDRFGAAAHVFSTYESRRAATDAKPYVRGINSIQLFFDGKRWWVATIFWDSERPDQAIPQEYLPAQ
jgi:hypothetical protein